MLLRLPGRGRASCLAGGADRSIDVRVLAIVHGNSQEALEVAARTTVEDFPIVRHGKDRRLLRAVA